MKTHDNQSSHDGHTNSLKVWALTAGLSFIILVADLVILHLAVSEQISMIWAVPAIGLVTFIGMLIVSSYHSEMRPSLVKGSKGIMRKGLASSLVAVYIVVLSLILFGIDFIPTKLTSGENALKPIDVLDHFTNIIVIILAFYFGTRGTAEIIKSVKGKNSDVDEKKSSTPSKDNADSTICVIADDSDDEEKKNISFSSERPLHRESDIKWNKQTVTFSLIKGTRDMMDDSDLLEKRAMNLAMMTWKVEIPLDLKLVKKDQNPDITVEFKHVSEDSYLQNRPWILGYAYRPTEGPLEGTLVLNDDKLWSLRGEPIDAETYIRITGRQVANPTNTFPTYNLLSTMIHELGHTLGMPHIDDCEECIMYTHDNNKMELHDQDIAIIQSKYGTPTRPEGEIRRLKRWLAKRIREDPNSD